LASPVPGAGGQYEPGYTNPLGVQLAPCTYCGFCEKFGCGNFSKSSPQTTIIPVLMKKPNFRLRTHCEVMQVLKDRNGPRATGVTYIDAHGKLWEQPAEIVILCGYQLSNTRLMMLSGIGEIYNPRTGEGLVGKNYTYQVMSGIDIFFEEEFTNEFIGAGALGMVVDDYNGDNFDHSGLGFIGGAYIAAGPPTSGRSNPIPCPRARPNGARMEARGPEELPQAHLAVDPRRLHGAPRQLSRPRPNYTDVWGRPLMRMTYDFTENDRRLSDYITPIAEEIAATWAGARSSVTRANSTTTYDIVPYQTTHNTGGTIMGETPADSVVNRYLQSWELHNLFVMGAGVFPQNAGYNPTDTVAALTYWSAQAIREQYLRNPGPAGAGMMRAPSCAASAASAGRGAAPPRNSPPRRSSAAAISPSPPTASAATPTSTTTAFPGPAGANWRPRSASSSRPTSPSTTRPASGATRATISGAPARGHAPRRRAALSGLSLSLFHPHAATGRRRDLRLPADHRAGPRPTIVPEEELPRPFQSARPCGPGNC
jgi:choline dehydrogenase-like flavoprotein